jgi:hypothetical protein
MSIWTILFAMLLVAWISGFTMFHVAGGLIRRIFALPRLPAHTTIRSSGLLPSERRRGRFSSRPRILSDSFPFA